MLIGLAIRLLCAPAARGAISTVDMQLTTSFSGTPPPSHAQPWMDAVFQDIGNNKVQVTITAPNITSSEYDHLLYFNFTDTKNVNNLIFTPVSAQGAAFPSVSKGVNKFQGDSGGNYDIQLSFPSANSSLQFNGGDKIVLTITSSQGMSFSSLDFAMLSQPGKAGAFYAAAEIVTPGKNQNVEGFIGDKTPPTITSVPEMPSGLWAGALCLSGIVLGLRRFGVFRLV
jgi:hypothetical protein